MPDLPSGTVTFLFTDIEGSTALWERDQAAMATAVARHLTLLRAAIEAHDGVALQGGRRCGAGRLPHRSGCGCRGARCPASAGAGDVARSGRTAAGPDGPAYRRRDAAGRGLSRSRAEPPGSPACCGATAGRCSSPWPRRILPGTRSRQEPACATWASIRCATSTDPSGSSNCCIPICRPTSPRSGRWPPAPTTCPCNRRPFLAGRIRSPGSLTSSAAMTSGS